MAENQTSKDRLRDITESIETGIKDLFQSDKYAQYLRTMSRFHKYSVNNTMLIFMQRPDATLCAGFNKWRDQFGRNVMKGEKGIKIIAPTPFKKKIEETKLDPDTRLPVLDADGRVVTEEKEVKIPMYKVVSVFDVAQTQGKALPTLAADLAGNVQNYDVFMEALRRSAPVPITTAAIAANMDGYFSPEEQRIVIREGMSEVQTVSATVHEIAHSKLHNSKKREVPEIDAQYESIELFGKPALFSNERVDRSTLPEGLYSYDLRGSDDDPGQPATIEANVTVNHAGSVITTEPIEFPEQGFIAAVDNINFLGDSKTIRSFIEEVKPELAKKSRNTEEVEAESISYAVCAYYGIATGENSFGYIASWSQGKELIELRASLETINQTASGLITDIDRHYAEIMKERGLDVEVEPVEAEKPEPEIVGMEAHEPRYEYKLHANPRSTGEKDAAFIQAYQRTAEGLVPREIIGFDTYDKLIPVTNELNAAEKTPKEAKAVLDSVVADESAEMPAPEIGVEEPLSETAPDNGYMPDPTVSVESMNAYGYTDQDMLPLSKDRAIELAERDVTVYMLYDDNTEAMAFEPEEINNHSGMFGITREDWETVRDQFPTEQSKPDLESAFLSATGDAYVIYQLTDSDENAERRFMGTEYLAKSGIPIEHDRYEAVYTGELSADGDTYDKLNGLYRTFNIDHPADFTGHSLSVSDIIALKQAGVISCHYVDSWGFKELPMFLKPENYLKNAEMAMEDDYGMIDGVLNNGQRQQTTAELEEQAKSGKPISLLSYVEAVRRERAENEPKKQPEESSRKPSVLAKLKSPITPANPTKTAPSKSAEREI